MTLKVVFAAIAAAAMFAPMSADPAESVEYAWAKSHKFDGDAAAALKTCGELDGTIEDKGYVRICDVFGTGFFYIPGTDTCLKLSGYVRAESHCVAYGDNPAAVEDCEKNDGKPEEQDGKTICILPGEAK